MTGDVKYGSSSKKLNLYKPVKKKLINNCIQKQQQETQIARFH